MAYTTLRLYKKEKLCSTVAIDQLFGRGGASVSIKSALAYPVRAVWRSNCRRRSDAKVQFLVSVPKRRLRHAVDRVQMRRRIREAYRLARPDFPMAEETRIDVAFIYVASELTPFASVDRAIRKLLDKIAASSALLTSEDPTFRAKTDQTD
ncbi:MAG: ribonuclease P protein component [Muribaculaceae bacterium]|nr:ribonuclease P protein component [Muribaculaceae bacterium]